jgi:uncharacterized cupredoxin-like copper-binding protein
MKRLLFAAAVIAIITAACGGGDGDGDDHSKMDMGESTATTGATGAVTRTVEITMVDIAFEPKTLSVQRGERIEFVFHNRGNISHDAFFGETAAQADHEKEMREMEGEGHDMAAGEANAITVEAGKTGRLTYTFDKPGTIEIGCHQPGHYAAGMKIAVTVA